MAESNHNANPPKRGVPDRQSRTLENRIDEAVFRLYGVEGLPE
jgi:hypothetical protein